MRRHRPLGTPAARRPRPARLVVSREGDLLQQLRVAAVDADPGLELSGDDGKNPEVVVVMDDAPWPRTGVGQLLVHDLTDPPSDISAAGDDLWADGTGPDLVTTSVRVDSLMVPSGAPVAEVPLMLDESWFGPLTDLSPPEPPPPSPANTLRLLHIVPPRSDTVDLQELHTIIRRIPDDLGRPIRLTVVTMDGPIRTADWFRGLRLPLGDLRARIDWLRRTGANHDVGLAPLAADAAPTVGHEVVRLVLGAIGCPTVFARHGAFAAVVEGETGLLSEPGDIDAWVAAIAELTDPEVHDRVAGLLAAEVRRGRRHHRLWSSALAQTLQTT